ncbi:hypothetical protein QFC22_005140 [Naganishia vaughanmartiniae]|uniref:Uncharacterized protein n=1 Tax=Naganishia vaughanmartiniae TaxID=1424756 RepID=A0ACC2WVP8_9TREE|nr:hypothetical protein QFC22_005140 [Naganishia vaughanmartiniae]
MPGSLYVLLGDAYDKGARVHTNSWGASVPSILYEAASSRVLVDEFVYTQNDLVVLFAAGNDGVDATSQPGSMMRPDQPDVLVDLAQVGAEAVAKSIITVGACESQRTDVAWNLWGKWRTKFPVALLEQEHFANSRDDMAAFSSRDPAMADKGDTKHLRTKPHLVAPGGAILSTKSRHPTVHSDYTPGHGLPTRRSTPSAALVKALLISAAVPLATEWKHPYFAAGFSRVDLKRSIVPSDTLAITNASGFLEGPLLRQGETNTIAVIIPATTTACTFKVTLVWTDFPGKLLVNDLDLVVKATDEERHGNIKPGSNDSDRVNNVEQVI